MRVTQIGEDALLFVFTPAGANTVDELIQQNLWQLSAWLEARRETLGLVEIVPGMGNLLLRSGLETPLNTLQELVLSYWPDIQSENMEPRHVEIPVHYGEEFGPDLEAVAAHCGISTHTLIELHADTHYRVYCLGFQPGFAYLSGLDPRLHVPRRDTPRINVPAGSVAIGGAQTAVYPFASPGGWHLIGRTDTPLFNPASVQATLLRPGDIVRFVPSGEPT